MQALQAPARVSVPRPFTAQASYTDGPTESSAEPPKRAEFTDVSASIWLTRGRIGDALARAAERVGKPMKAELLLAAARLTTYVPRAVLEEELAVLVNAGRLDVEEVPDPARPLLGRVRVYSAPRGLEP